MTSKPRSVRPYYPCKVSPGDLLMESDPWHVRGIVGDIVQQVATGRVLHDYRKVLICQEHLRRHGTAV